MVAESQLMGSHEDRWRIKFPRHRDIRSRLMVDLPWSTNDRRSLTVPRPFEDLPFPGDKTEIPLLSFARIEQ